ncbi:hypothetical protein CHGG_06771 [Chaetomium globosum CBS 148.51]|uniref:NAD(P)H-hydrate epimerase n=1 Tax=Chaetomium globosum (strain ATCC 6205 / CBS 148.51 / DSM 1962 / NBRC 6347 / NRRL 1970) TaxID=306901 RepID=Q2H3J4_CHAGB|nr:uncharacterized protein CHGG_06771 [Chaetomium globosum CBS 148.51]EAQ90152.1 hypothetical protein CHGG_06771 [Chaetomium globosum CBS 148.51]
MSLKTLSAKAAAALDKELMSTGAFSLDQLMELAGLSVSQVVYRVHPPNMGQRVLVAVGPGNNGERPLFTFACFSGEVREPFPAVIQAMAETKVPVTSVDAPSSWDIEAGPPPSGVGSNFHPGVLISLTAPKPLVKHFRGRHFIGGRFVAPGIANKYDFDVPAYEGIDQIVEVGSEGLKL